MRHGDVLISNQKRLLFHQDQVIIAILFGEIKRYKIIEEAENLKSRQTTT
jgi:hypothetical protein